MNLKDKNYFETKSLIIRDSVPEDLGHFYSWELLLEVTKFFSIKDNQNFQEVLDKFEEDNDNPNAKQFTIILKETGDPIGRIVLGDVITGFKGEIWRIYIGDVSLRGKGYGYEAMREMMRYAFEDLGLKRLYLDHYTGNPASKLYLDLGFQYEGILRNNCRKNGKLYDVHLMSMLKSEYEALYGELK